MQSVDQHNGFKFLLNEHSYLSAILISEHLINHFLKKFIVKTLDYRNKNAQIQLI